MENKSAAENEMLKGEMECNINRFLGSNELHQPLA